MPRRPTRRLYSSLKTPLRHDAQHHCCLRTKQQQQKTPQAPTSSKNDEEARRLHEEQKKQNRAPADETHTITSPKTEGSR